MSDDIDPAMEVGELRVVREADGMVALLAYPGDGVGVIRMGLGYRQNASRLGKALIEANESAAPVVKRLRRVQPTLVEAANQLFAQFGLEPWFQSVGHDTKGRLHLYLKKKTRVKLPSEHAGYPVDVKVIGPVRPA